MRNLFRLLILPCVLLPLLGCQLFSSLVGPGLEGVETEVIPETPTILPETLTPSPLAPTETTVPVAETPSPTPETPTETAVLETPLVLSNREIREESETPKYEIRIDYPYLEGGTDSQAEGFNQAVERIVTENVQSFKEGTESTVDDPYAQDMLSSLDIGYTTTYSSNQLLSVLFRVGFYMAGAAHPGSYSHTLTYDLRQEEALALEDLFQPGSEYLETIAEYCLQDLRDNGVLEWEEGAQPTRENYQNWNITPEGLLITFDVYQVASYAAGPQKVMVPYEVLQPIIHTDGPIGELMP